MEAMLFVYFANVLPQISQVLGGSIVTGVTLFCLWTIFGGIALSDYRKEFNWKAYKKPMWIIGIPVIVMCTIKPLIPNRDTMYLMAGAYIGQQVLTSDIAKDAYEIIGLEVKRVLKEKKEEVSSKVEGVK